MSILRKRQAGIALVLVVWVATLLLAIGASFLYATRTDARAMRNAATLAKAEAYALAAVARALLEAQKPAGSPGAWRRSPLPRDWPFEGAAIRITLLDESAKIDVNSANDSVLLSLLRTVGGMGADEAAQVLDAILDWRDADSLRRPNGAEEREYAEAGLGWRPSNQPFQSLEEVQLVLGLSPDVYRRIAPMITVHSRLPGVNPHYASRDVLLALPNVTEEQVDAYIAERDAAFEASVQPPAFAAAGPYANYSPSSAVRVRVEVGTEDGAWRAWEAVGVLTPQFPQRPYALLAWRELAKPRIPAPAAEGEAVAR